MEYYFSGTIDRIIFENASNFFKILLLTVEDTDSDMDDFEIIVTGTILMSSKVRIILLGRVNTTPKIWSAS